MSVPHNLRSAAIVAMATAVLGGTSALAAQLKPSTTPPAHTEAAAHRAAESTESRRPDPSPSHKSDVIRGAKPSEKPDPTGTPKVADSPEAAETPEAGESGNGGAHGACVSRAAHNHAAVAADTHGKSNHGAAVSRAAHDCPK